nr:uncharacterized protein LOC109423234 [Aedes albopictus]
MPKRKAQAAVYQQDAKVVKVVAADQVEQVGNTDWDVLSYRSHYEPEEHWELRRRFMELHQNWIPEDELVCLAQVFVNVELLHCRYPLETMERIKELSEGIADEYRNSRKNKLQRTFVSASDAAASKVQRKGPGEQVPQQRNLVVDKKFKPFYSIRSMEDIYNNVVLMNNDYEQTQLEFDRMGKEKMSIVFSKNAEGKTVGAVKVGQFTVVETAVDGGEKAARKAVKVVFLGVMANHCYTIMRKKRPTELTNTNVERKQVEGAVDHRGRKVVEDFQEKKIGESNLGFKLLQKLGWTGGSLGSKNQGIVDPINCQIKIGRQGLGSGPAEKKQGEEANKKGKINTRNETYGIDINFYRQMMRNFKNSDLEYDLVFSSEFTKEERALFHNMAQNLQLKTRSYGNDNDGTRQFVLLGRKLPPHELLERILVEKDPVFCEMYEVRPPRKTTKNESLHPEQSDEDDSELSETVSNYVELPSSFKPIIPVQTLDDLRTNIVLVNKNFRRTCEAFNQLQCGKLEFVTAPVDTKPGTFKTKIVVGEFTLIEAEAVGQRRAEVIAQRDFMHNMNMWCYRITRKKKPQLIAKINPQAPKVNEYKAYQISEDNMGFRMLKRCGWTGGALGPREDGIVEPLAVGKGFYGFLQDHAKQFVERQRNFDLEHYRRLIEEFSRNGVEYDLIFSAQFSKEERAQLHSIAQELSVKSQSFGKNDRRQLLLYGKPLTTHEILQRVLIQKDPLISEMFKVQLPKKLLYRDQVL